MIQPKIQEVYIEFTDSLFNEEYNGLTLSNSDGKYIQDLVEMNCYCFTPEEFETFKREFGKELLEKAADNAYVDNNHQQGCSWDSDDFEVNKESITSVLDEYLLNNKI
jgi:hypothetical protein